MLSKPQVIFFSDTEEIVDRVYRQLSNQFDIMPVSGISGVQEALKIIRQLMPDYVLVDPLLPDLDHRQLHQLIQMDPQIQGVQILVIREDEWD